jgi:DHA1 family multidrug resistance protein-like MFS transporter
MLEETKISLDDKLGKQARILLIAVLMSVSFRTMGMTMVSIGLPSFVESVAGSLTSYGIIIGTFSLTQCIFQFPFAAASDKYGRRKVVLFGMLIYLLGTLLCFTAQDIIQLMIYRAIQGIGAYTSILQALVGDIYKKNQHSKGMGYYSILVSVGSFIGFILGGYISSFLGFRSVFLIQGFLISVSIIFIFFVLKKKKKSETAEVQNKNMDVNLKNLKVLIKERQYIFTLLNSCVRWFLYGFITAYIIWVLLDNVQGYGVNQITSSYIMLAIMALYVLFIFLSSLLLRRYSSRKIMILGQLIVMVSGITIVFRDFVMNLPVFFIVVLFFGIGIGLFGPAGNTLLLEVIEDIQPDLKGSGIGFNNAIGFFCMAIAPMIMSSLGEIDIFIPFYVTIGLMVVALIVSQFFIDKKY